MSRRCAIAISAGDDATLIAVAEDGPSSVQPTGGSHGVDCPSGIARGAVGGLISAWFRARAPSLVLGC
jgi:hypothetical protein